MKLIGRARLGQLATDRLAPHEPGDAAQDLHMQARRFLGAHDHEEEADRLAVDAVVGDRRAAHAAYDGELPDPGGPGVGDRDSESDPGAQHCLSFQHGGENLIERAARAVHQVPRKLSENAGLIGSGKGNHDPVRCEQLGQKDGSASRGMAQT